MSGAGQGGLQALHACIQRKKLIILIQNPTHITPTSDIWSCASPAFAELLASQQQPDSFGPRPPTAKAPTRAALARGDYQLIRMELCRHGDLEAYLR